MQTPDLPRFVKVTSDLALSSSLSALPMTPESTATGTTRAPPWAKSPIVDTDGLLALATRCAAHIAPSLIFALVKQESGFQLWAIGPDSGMQPLARQPQSLKEAVEMAQKMQSQGLRFSVGLAQIHSSNVERMSLSWEQAFDPCTNLQAGQRVLLKFWYQALEQKFSGTEAVRAALRGYNSGNVLRMVSEPYAEAILKRVQAFGASPRQATLTFDGEPKLSPQWQRHWETMR